MPNSKTLILSSRQIQQRINRIAYQIYENNYQEKEWKNKVVIVVDDVLESGRTMMYSIDPFLKCSVKRLTTVVLVDRDHHSYPVKADFVGISLVTTMQEHISVELNGGKNDAVYLT